MRTSFLLALALPGISLAADWPQFRGEASRGTSSDAKPPQTFDKTKSIAWKTDLPGRGLSSPVIVGDRIFLTAASGPKQEKLHVICLNAADGTRRWEREFRATGRSMCHDKTCVAAPTPCSDGKVVCAMYSTNDVVCLDLDGGLKWLRGLTLDYPNASNSLGMASSPVIAGGTLVAQVENDSESFIAGIDLATGVNRWKLDRPKDANWTSPAVWRDGERDLILCISPKNSVALDPQTGKEQWSLAGGNAVPSAVVSPPWIATPVNGMSVYKLEGGTTPPVLKWESNQVSAGTSSPIVQGKHIFAVNGAGVITCAEVETGERLWKLRIDGPFSGSPVMAGSMLYIASERGLLQAVDTAAEPEGKVTGTLDLGETVLCTPSLSGDSIYLRSDAHIWRIR